jgi:hypothetical protein
VEQFHKLWSNSTSCGAVPQFVEQFHKLWSSSKSCGAVLQIEEQFRKLWSSSTNFEIVAFFVGLRGYCQIYVTRELRCKSLKFAIQLQGLIEILLVYLPQYFFIVQVNSRQNHDSRFITAGLVSSNFIL